MIGSTLLRTLFAGSMGLGFCIFLGVSFAPPASAQGASSGMQSFRNDSSLVSITLRRRAAPNTEITLPPLAIRPIPVTLGDVFDVVTTGPEKAAPVFVNHLSSYPMVITPMKPYRDIDPRGQHVFMGRDLATAYFGFDLRQFNSRDIVSSTGSGRIFSGLQPETTEYEILAGGYVPRGCGYGDRNTSEGEDSYEKIFTHDAFLKSWEIGVTGDIPLGATPASLGLNLAYGETETRNSTTNNVYIVNHKKDVRYFVNCDPIDKRGNVKPRVARLTRDFVRAVERVGDASSADAFIDTFGTHYAAEVNYGGHRSSWVIIEESDYYEGLEQKVDFAAEVKVAAGSQKVAVAKPLTGTNPFARPGTTTTTTNEQSSPGGSGGLSFSQTQKKEARDILQKSESRFFAAGGEGALVGAWSVPAESAVPVSAELRRIDKLVRPELFQSAHTEAVLGPKRALIGQAVDRAIAQVPRIPNPEQKRGYRFRIRSVRFEVDVDDLSHEMKGRVSAAIRYGSTLVDRYDLWSSNNGWVNPRKVWERPGPWFEHEQQADADGRYAPLSISLQGDLIDNDAGVADTCRSGWPHCDDPITFPAEELARRLSLDGLDRMTTVNVKMKGFKTHAEKTTLNITLQVQPMTFIGNQNNVGSTARSASSTNTSAGSAVRTSLPARHDPRASVLDPAFYLDHHADLERAFGNDHAAALNHWLRFGIREGRQSSPGFSVSEYVARYADVRQAVGGNYAAALDHWLKTGREELRDPRPVVAEVKAGAALPADSDYKRIRNSWYKDRYIHGQNGAIEVGAVAADWSSAQWKLVPAHSGWVRIQNRSNTEHFIHNQNGKLEVGAIQPNWASALWKFVPTHSGWGRLQNGWYKDRYIHNQNGAIEIGPIDSNWASALWKLE